jgi:hypothetical protein
VECNIFMRSPLLPFVEQQSRKRTYTAAGEY